MDDKAGYSLENSYVVIDESILQQCFRCFSWTLGSSSPAPYSHPIMVTSHHFHVKLEASKQSPHINIFLPATKSRQKNWTSNCSSCRPCVVANPADCECLWTDEWEVNSKELWQKQSCNVGLYWIQMFIIVENLHLHKIWKIWLFVRFYNMLNKVLWKNKLQLDNWYRVY